MTVLDKREPEREIEEKYICHDCGWEGTESQLQTKTISHLGQGKWEGCEGIEFTRESACPRCRSDQVEAT